ncbi:predicted protein [Arabidopsis lyrata subsp. lyrata]|uniref:Predicted protein n=1 Tax=Arabidopsis lyrata subsp. lyrata TaxID=81972 RepID=D7L9N1_ARALL|nr:predicted protein [Arabidopsis lyrata subsp. lyrata]
MTSVAQTFKVFLFIHLPAFSFFSFSPRKRRIRGGSWFSSKNPITAIQSNSANSLEKPTAKPP